MSNRTRLFLFWTVVAVAIAGVITYYCYCYKDPQAFIWGIFLSALCALIVNSCYNDLLYVPIEEYRIVKVVDTDLTLPTRTKYWIEMKHKDILLNKEFWHKIIKHENESIIKQILENIKNGVSPHSASKEEIIK